MLDGGSIPQLLHPELRNERFTLISFMGVHCNIKHIYSHLKSVFTIENRVNSHFQVALIWLGKMFMANLHASLDSKWKGSVVSWFSHKQNQFLLRRQAFTWTLSRLHLVWGKCFPNFIIAKMLYGKMCVPQFWTPIFMICCIILDCGKDFIIATCMWFGIFDRISPIEVVSRCYC